MSELIVVGGGLAGCEAAWQAAERGVRVQLYEMRPGVQTGAHQTAGLAELVCSNSLGSKLPDRATGLLQTETLRLGSLLLKIAQECAVPAGGALAVDRQLFSKTVTETITSHPNIPLVRKELHQIPDGVSVIASGPLTSAALAASIGEWTGEQQLFFFDAIAPIVSYESIDMTIAYRGSRYDRGDLDAGDYINCPMTEQEYAEFIQALANAEQIELHDFEKMIETGVRAGVERYFEGCLPIEILLSRGQDSLAFGPLRPVGLIDPRNGRRPYAVVQLRQDNLAGTLYNMVGFQTNLKFAEQRRVFRLIPGLQQAEFSRYGQMHRNTFIFSPTILRPNLQTENRLGLFFAGQITGVEGYVGNIATGLLAGLNAARFLHGEELIVLPPTTMLGALCHYITHASAQDFQPMKANFGILPPLPEPIPRGKRERAAAYSRRALNDIEDLASRIFFIIENQHKN